MINRSLSLRAKLFLAFFLSSAIITIAISYTLAVHMRTDHLNTLKRDLTAIASLAVTQEEGKKIGHLIKADEKAYKGKEAVYDFYQRLAREGLNIDRVLVWIITSNGEYVPLADSHESALSTDQHSFAVAYQSVLPKGLSSPVILEMPQRELEIIAFAPINDENAKIVALAGIIVNGTAVAQDLQHFVLQVIKVAALAIVVVGVISWWLARNFSRRLTRLYTAIDEMAAGNLNIALQETGHDELSLMTNRLNQLAASLASEREDMLLAAIESLVAALEAKDAYTYGHSSQVSAMAAAIGQQIGLPEKELFTIRIAALLHDIGKIGIPDQVLNKPGRLDEEERRLIEQHPEIGAKILAGIPALAQVTEMVKHHHARWDGTGYPEKLKGQTIPLGSRIIAIADTFQAMTSDRPYRKGMAAEVALAELHRCAGNQFDPVLVTAFFTTWSEAVKEEKQSK